MTEPRSPLAGPLLPATKVCGRCRADKPVSEFYAERRNRDGLKGHCKACRNKGTNAGYRSWYDKLPEGRSSYTRRYSLMSKFGITPEQFDEMLDGQGGVCAICKEPPAPGGRPFHVDHDHDHDCCPSAVKTCGRCIRGVLCESCNFGLGQFKDSVDALLNAVQCLRSPR